MVHHKFRHRLPAHQHALHRAVGRHVRWLVLLRIRQANGADDGPVQLRGRQEILLAFVVVVAIPNIAVVDGPAEPKGQRLPAFVDAPGRDGEERRMPCGGARRNRWAIVSDSNVLGARNLDQGKSLVREILRVVMTAVQPFRADSRCTGSLGVPWTTVTKSGWGSIFCTSRTKIEVETSSCTKRLRTSFPNLPVAPSKHTFILFR